MFTQGTSPQPSWATSGLLKSSYSGLLTDLTCWIHSLQEEQSKDLCTTSGSLFGCPMRCCVSAGIPHLLGTMSTGILLWTPEFSGLLLAARFPAAPQPRSHWVEMCLLFSAVYPLAQSQLRERRERRERRKERERER